MPMEPTPEAASCSRRIARRRPLKVARSTRATAPGEGSQPEDLWPNGRGRELLDGSAGDGAELDELEEDSDGED